MPEIVVKDSLEKIELFGEVDKVNGKVGSEYPAWYFTTQKQEIEDGIRRVEFNLSEGLVPERGKPAAIAELKKAQEKLDRINESTPNLSSKDKEAFAKMSKEIGVKISAATHSRSEEVKGLVDAHEVYRRQIEPVIDLEGDMHIIAKKLGCRIYSGKVSLNDASKIWKVMRKANGENPDIEVLRRS